MICHSSQKAEINMCNVDVEEESTCHWIALINKFLETFGFLADSFVVDFYAERHWDLLPSSWQHFLPTINPEELGDVLDLRNANGWKASLARGEIPPLALQALRSSTKLLSLDRKQAALENFGNVSSYNDDGPVQTIISDEFKKLFCKHVKPKKRHEVEEFSKVVSAMSGSTRTKQIFDVGSGLGHLSRYLTYGCSLNLTCIDSEDQFGQSAAKLDSELEKCLSKRDVKLSSQPPSHLCLKLELDKHEKELQISENFAIVGLHTCGNLGPVIIHNFVNSNAKFVVSVGCCYMKLDSSGYPLSKYGKDKRSQLSYEAMEVSCHAIEQYCHQLKQGQVLKLMVHSYRATLETLLIDNFNMKRAGLKGVRGCEKMSFADYAKKATCNLGIVLSESLLQNDKFDQMLKDWYKVVLFYSIRLFIANIVETLVILDRALFVKENVKDSIVKILTLFDPEISPRNFVIVSSRSSL